MTDDGSDDDASDDDGGDGNDDEPADVEAPLPGGGGALTVVARTATAVTLEWEEATDETVEAGNLQYKVVRAATAEELDTLEKAQAATTVIDWTKAMTNTVATGLEAATVYAFTVLVRDSAGNVAPYAPVTQHTLPDISDRDPSFEEWEGGISPHFFRNGSPRLKSSSTYAHDGEKSAWFDTSDYIAMRYGFSTKIKLVGGKQYKFKLWAYTVEKSPGQPLSDLRLELTPFYYSDSDYMYGGSTFKANNLTLDQWVPVEITFTPPLEANGMYMDIAGYAKSNFHLYLDDFSLVEVE